MSSTSRDNLSCFLTNIPLIYFRPLGNNKYCVIAISKTPISILNKSRESENPCHILGCRVNGLKYFLFSIFCLLWSSTDHVPPGGGVAQADNHRHYKMALERGYGGEASSVMLFLVLCYLCFHIRTNTSRFRWLVEFNYFFKYVFTYSFEMRLILSEETFALLRRDWIEEGLLCCIFLLD